MPDDRSIKAVDIAAVTPGASFGVVAGFFSANIHLKTIEPACEEISYRAGLSRFEGWATCLTIIRMKLEPLLAPRDGVLYNTLTHDTPE